MGPVRLRFASELRGRWRTWLVLALVVGLMGALVIAAAAGAGRTESAYHRFLVAYGAADVILPDDGETPPPPDLHKVARLPQVAETARGRLFYGPENIAVLAPADERIGTRINRYRLLEGRLPEPGRIDGVLIGFTAAERLHFGVGSTFPLVEPQFEAEARRLGVENVTFRVVGIEASPGEFPPQYPGLTTLIHTTAAFYEKYAGGEALPRRDSLLVRLKRGQADVPSFISALERLAGGKPVFFQTQAQLTAPIQRSFHLQAIALWLLAGLVALTAALVLGQALARQALLDSTEHPALLALGMTRRQLFALGMGRAAAVALPAAGVAVVVGYLLSPPMPLGVARKAEPDPGFALDPPALALGGLATAGIALGVAAIPAWRATRLAGSVLGTAEPAGARRPSAAVSRLARAGASPSLVAGVRMALEPGRGRSAVPMRTTLAGLVLAVAALSAALVFGASLDHLLTTPRLYGWNWDLEVTNYGSGNRPNLNPRAGSLAATPGVAALSIGTGGIPINVGRLTEIGGLAVDGPVAPPVLEGRRPAGPDELALGTKTMRRARVGIGDAVDARLPGLKPRSMTVIGRVVLPTTVDARLGEGVLMTQAALRRLLGGAPEVIRTGVGTDVYVRLAPGADRRAVLAALRPTFGFPFNVIENEKPSDIVNFGRVKSLPLILAGILGLLASATLAHLLVTGVNRRQRDLAVLKTVGFVRRQVVATVLWDAATLAAIALVLGMPLGVAGGRWAWAPLADEIGVAREPVVPMVPLVVVIAATVLAASVVALLPARIASRTPPARVLRTE